MTDFLWDSAWETGVTAIDDQHRELISRMNQVSQGFKDGREVIEIGKMLIYMKRYVEFHFDTEEALMLGSDYPGYDRHSRIHTDMRQKVKYILDDYFVEKGFDPNDVLNFLLTWLSDHINTEDRAMATYFKGIDLS